LIVAQHLTVPRTARYFCLGPKDDPPPSQLWVVLHGYGQLAGRFLEDFEPLSHRSRLIVAPEALSRFYLESASSGRHADRVGASWMTRDDREHEIEDTLRYLDSLHQHLTEAFRSPAWRMLVLGFSQGSAAAARWVAHHRARAEELVLWGGLLPPDVVPEDYRRLENGCRITFVVGREDPWIDSAQVAAQAKSLERLGLATRVLEHPGGHRLDVDVLRMLGGSLLES